MKTITRFFPYMAIAALLALLEAQGVMGQSAMESAPQAGRRPLGRAFWAYNPQTMQDARDMSTLVVVARVAAMQTGPDLVVPAKREPTGESRHPTQRIQVEVLDEVKGKPAATLTVFHTGSDSWHLEGDPSYQVGEIYLLFLIARGDGSYHVLSPEGRYYVEDSRLRPVAKARRFAPSLAGASLATVLGQLRAPHPQ